MTASDGRLKSDLILETVRGLAADRQIIDVDEEQVKVVIFRSGGRLYGFPGRQVREILPPLEIFWAPGLPEYLPGLINVRGEVEAVLDLRYFLDGTGGDCDRCYIAIVAEGEFRAGVAIDTVEEVADVVASAIKPALSTLPDPVRELVAGELEYRGELVVLLELAKLAAKASP